MTLIHPTAVIDPKAELDGGLSPRLPQEKSKWLLSYQC